MKIGITGATGFLGTYLLKFFIEKSNYSIRAISRTIPLKNYQGAEKVNWLRGDLSSIKVCEDFVCNLDVVIHLAHTNSPLSSDYDLPSDATSNMVPTLNLLQAVRAQDNRLHFIYSSSGGAIYANRKTRKIFKESDICLPENSYGIQKLAGEHYLRMAAKKDWLTAICLRIGNPYGVLLPPERMQGLIGVALTQVLNKQPVKIFGSPHNVRDYIHLLDMCHAFAKVLTPKNSFDIFNIGSGRGYSVDEILYLLEKYSGQKIVRQCVASDATLNYLPSWAVLDVSKAKENIGWEPSIDLETGLKQLCNELILRS